MAKGDYGATALVNMGMRAADPQVSSYEKAKDALRVAPQLAAAELQFCIAFRLDPFSYLAAKLAESAAIRDERQDRIASEDFHEKEQRQRAAWSG